MSYLSHSRGYYMERDRNVQRERRPKLRIACFSPRQPGWKFPYEEQTKFVPGRGLTCLRPIDRVKIKVPQTCLSNKASCTYNTSADLCTRHLHVTQWDASKTKGRKASVSPACVYGCTIAWYLWTRITQSWTLQLQNSKLQNASADTSLSHTGAQNNRAQCASTSELMCLLICDNSLVLTFSLYMWASL